MDLLLVVILSFIAYCNKQRIFVRCSRSTTVLFRSIRPHQVLSELWI